MILSYEGLDNPLYQVQYEQKLKDQEMTHGYSQRDLIAKYDQLIMEKDDSFQERLRSLDDKVYCLESELTMVGGGFNKIGSREKEEEDLTIEDKENRDNDMMRSNEFLVHVTEHASLPADHGRETKITTCLSSNL